jgi:hypothetical protein
MIFLIPRLPTLIFCLLAQVTPSEEPQLFRYDFADAAKHLRATMISDLSQMHEKDRVVSFSLLSSGGMRFIKINEIDRRANLRIETIVNAKRQKVEFRRDANTELTAGERRSGAGMLTLGGRSVKITPNAETTAMRREVRLMLSAWDPREREALEVLYKETMACGLHAGFGVLLPILFGGARGGGCQPGMREADPDPAWDREFVAIVPELAEVLKKPAMLVTNSGAPR